MKKGGLADSPFFRLPQQVEPQAAPPPPQNQAPIKRAAVSRKKKPVKKKRATNHDTVIPRHRDTMLDTTIPRYHDTIIEIARKAVKEYGKEAATHRFTLQEKKALADIIYAYRGRGIKTSENEVARIAINFIISDYEENGENSILHQAINALKS